MRLTSAHPGGRRMLPGDRSKHKGLQFQRGTPAGAGQTFAQFHQVWDWDGFIRPQLDLIAATSDTNAVKTFAGLSAAADGTVTEAVLLAHLEEEIAYCRTLGLRAYVCMFATEGSATDPTNLALAVAVARMLDGYSNVIGIDMINEPIADLGLSGCLAHCNALRPALKAVTGIPLSVGMLCGSAAYLTGSDMQSVARFTDFTDFHPYFAGNMAPSDLTTYRAASWYKPWVIGENGSNSADHSVVQARWEAIGALTAEPDCFGAFGYQTLEWATTPGYGMYPNLTSPARSWVLTPYEAWPAR